MTAWVRFRLPSGDEVRVGEGGLVGRAAQAQLRLTGGGVSEGHALVSRRGGELRLLALRGRLRVRGAPLAEVPLRPALRVWLGSEVELEVVEVHLSPDGGSDNPSTAADRPPPVRVRIEPGWVRLAEGDGPELVLGGNQADPVRLLAEAGEPQHWTQIARYFWPEREAASWRQRFDAMMKEVRRKLREHRIRGDLLWSWDGSHALKLHDGDTLVVVTDPLPDRAPPAG